MNILVLHSELGVLRGGGENFTRHLFAAFLKRGHKVSAAFVAGPRGGYPVALPAGISALPVNGFWTRTPGQSMLASIASYIPAESKAAAFFGRVMDSAEWRGARWHYGRFARRVEREFVGRWTDFDAVYVHSNVDLAAAASTHRPTILRLPGPVAPERAALLRKVQVVCANGDALEQLRNFLGDHVRELPVGLDSGAFAPVDSSIRKNCGWTEQDVVIGYAGRFSRLKGVDILAEAFQQVIAARSNARLLLIGHGEEEVRLRRVLAKHIAAGAVRIIPGLNTRELPAWYCGMDVFVLPSRYENFSNALLEAAACGVPIIASSVGGNRILNKTGVGELFEAGSAPALVDSIKEFIDDRDSRRAPARALSPMIRRRYSWDASVERLEYILASQFGIESRGAPVLAAPMEKTR